jgi:uncharacterized protein (DUF433 family)
MKDYKEILSINTEIRFGKPCVRSTRISVYDVLTLLASGMSKSEIIQDYPELTEEDIQACLAFASDPENKSNVV